MGVSLSPDTLSSAVDWFSVSSWRMYAVEERLRAAWPYPSGTTSAPIVNRQSWL